MICVGCDSDTKLVALAFEADGEWETWLTESPNSRASMLLIIDWLTMAVSVRAGEGHFVAENTFMYNNPKTTIRLAAMRGRVEAAALIAGYTVHDAVNNEVWKRTQLGILRGTKTADAKRISLERARLISGRNITDHNVADAMGISAWLAGQQRTARMRVAHGIL